MKPTISRHLLTCVLAIAAASLAAEEFTPHHVAKLRNVTSARIAPDGAKIAYVLAVPRRPGTDEDGAAWAELHLLSRDGASRPYVTGEVNVSEVAWTPDGRSIAFLAKRGKEEHKALYVIPYDGGEARRLLAVEGADITGFSFGPDGKRVAFLAKEAEPKEKKELEKKGFKQEVFEESAKPVRIWVAAVDEKGEAQKPKPLDVAGSASELHWSPSGARLAVALAPTSLVDQSYTSRKVHVLDADSGKVLARVENPGKLGDVAWSPGGQLLALVSAADPNDPAEGRLMVVPAAGGSLRDLLPDYPGHVRHIAWQDADTVMFLGDEGVGTAFGQVRRDGAGRRVHIASGPILTSFSLSREGRSAAFVGETPAHPGEVFLATHESHEPRRLTTSNPWLTPMRLAPQEIVKFKARDGLDLEGILIRPLDEKKETRYPLILTVHGGPEAHFRNGWLTSYSNAGQVGAARGFAVFYPNYRGSTGRGVAFSKIGQGDPAGKEFDDLVDGVDHLIATGLADRAKVGITGGSYGGYATAWGATYYTERFAAGVMFVGISDKVSKWGTTDIPEEEYLVHARHRVWEAWDLFRERSPIFHAGKSKTPLLILGGKDDPRVHPSQSLELYRHLKMRNKAPVRLVRYPGEEHGNTRAAARLDYNLRMIRWMEHYLKGPGGAPPPYELDYEPPAKPGAKREEEKREKTPSSR